MNNRITCLLPLTMHPNREAFEGLCFTFNDDIQDGSLVSATLPVGWKSVGNDGPWILLIDEKGRKRASYRCHKSQCHMGLHERFAIHSEMLSDLWPCPSRVFVKDHATNEILFVAGQFQSGQLEARDRFVSNASKYLDQHYPDWKDPTKYWD